MEFLSTQPGRDLATPKVTRLIPIRNCGSHQAPRPERHYHEVPVIYRGNGAWVMWVAAAAIGIMAIGFVSGLMTMWESL